MTRLKLDFELMKLITLFESSTGANVKDCIADDRATIFVIEEGQMGKAIGKNGSNIRRVENMLKKKIKLVEFSTDAVQFVRNLIYPVEAQEIRKEEDRIIIHGRDTSSRAMLIGRERQNINSITQIVRRYFDISEIKVI